MVLNAAGRPVSPHLDRHEWKLERIERLGSSDAGAILGLNPYTPPWEVWDRIVLGDWKDAEGADIRRGRKQESIALETFRERTALEVEPLTMVEHPDARELVTDLDGLLAHPGEDPWPELIHTNTTWAEVVGRARGPGALELKVPRVAKFYRMKAEGLDRDHLAQCQHHFMVSGLEWGFFGFYTPEYDDLIAFPVFRDADFCEWLMAAELDWLRSHVYTRPPQRPVRPPPPPPRWTDPVPGLAKQRDDPEWMERAALLVLRYYELADAQTQYDDTAAHLLDLVDEEERFVAGGGVEVKRKESSPRRMVDFGALRAAIQLARSAALGGSEEGMERLLEIDPDDDEWKRKTSTSVKTEITVRADNPYELQQVRDRDGE